MSKTLVFCERSSRDRQASGTTAVWSYHGRTVTSRIVRSDQSIVMNSSKPSTSSANRQSQITRKSAEMGRRQRRAPKRTRARVGIQLKRTNRWAVRHRLNKLR